MREIRGIAAARACVRGWRRRGCRIGFVPTMGALHEGHDALVRRSVDTCDRTIVSVFVNPRQFGPREDYRRYPRTLAGDRRRLNRLGADLLFVPSAASMYPRGSATFVEVDAPLARNLCGRFRPGHFRGVATVVTKLLHILEPDFVVFGQKDAQQVAVIRRLVRDLDIPVGVAVVPTVRETGGLASSSRNRMLTRDERGRAVAVFRALCAGRNAIRSGERRAGAVRRIMASVLAAEPRLRVQYLAIVDAVSLQPVARLRGRLLLAAAVFAGRTRLIDNVPVRVPR